VGVVAASTAALGAAAPSVQHGPARCGAARLHLAPSFYGAAGGQFIATFTFINLDRAACGMSGWPRVEIEDAAGRTVRAPIRRVVQGSSLSHPYSRVVVRPEGAASFDLYGADFDARSGRLCASTGAIRAAPPETGAFLVTRVKVPLCRFGFYLAPLVAGRSDRSSWSFVWRR
jgi:hypothetical protein